MSHNNNSMTGLFLFASFSSRREVTLRHKMRAHTFIPLCQMHNLHCIQERKKWNWIDFNRINVFSCLVLYFVSLIFTWHIGLFCCCCLNQYSIDLNFGLSETNITAPKRREKKMTLEKNIWTEAWTAEVHANTIESYNAPCISGFSLSKQMKREKNNERDESTSTFTLANSLLIHINIKCFWSFEFILDWKTTKNGTEKSELHARMHANIVCEVIWLHACVHVQSAGLFGSMLCRCLFF